MTKKGNKNFVLLELFNHCVNTNNFIIDTDIINHINNNRLKNIHDICKIDNLSILPNKIFDSGYSLIHIGDGKHMFIKFNIYHIFENINYFYNIEIEDYPFSESENVFISNLYNKKILNKFVLDANDGDIIESISPFPSKNNFEYTIDGISYKSNNQQIQIDGLFLKTDINRNMTIYIFEGKQNNSKNFNITQLFFPYLRLRKFYPNSNIISGFINKVDNEYNIHLYKFDNLELKSIEFLKSVQLSNVKII